ncbi:MAG: [FeFe] hydrogenase, group A [Holophagaceae bacterium]|nr:[FeFe] hydrogenase, group A [Holophagaceae bacterium]
MVDGKVITVDGFRVVVDDEQNLLQIIRKAHIELPTFCYHSELSVYGACRLCMVEVEGRGLVTACTTKPEPGMIIATQTPQVRELRRINIELLLASGNHDCPTCGKSGSCKLQSLAERLGVNEVRLKRPSEQKPLDLTSPSMLRDPNKCVLCGDCVRYCSEIQGIGVLDFTHRGSHSTVSPAFNKGLFDVDCVACGQCSVVCPVGALLVRSEIEKAHQYIQDPDKTVVVQVAPAVRAAIGEAFGIPSSTYAMGQIIAALRRLGFDKVFDTSFSADLTVWEEATEFLNRKKNGSKLPLFTSCCPAWVKMVEHNFPEILDNLSTCRSPQQMFGSIAKEMLPMEIGIKRENLVVVSIMPCTAKKYEAGRDEFYSSNQRDVDLVLTTQELIRMIHEAGIVFHDLPVESVDQPFGVKTGAGVIFANSGGVTEAVIRHVAGHLGDSDPTIEEVRSEKNRREFVLPIPGGETRMAVVYGLAKARDLVLEILAGDCNLEFVEVMACPGGCIGGAGQPVTHSATTRKVRTQTIRHIDTMLDAHCPTENRLVRDIYREHLGEPNSSEAHRLLHTHYHSRKRISGQGISLSEITGLAKIPVSICIGTACHLRGAQHLLKQVLKYVMDADLDEHFEISATFCMENCEHGPSVKVNGHHIRHATFETVTEILSATVAGTLPEMEISHGCAHK